MAALTDARERFTLWAIGVVLAGLVAALFGTIVLLDRAGEIAKAASLAESDAIARGVASLVESREEGYLKVLQAYAGRFRFRQAIEQRDRAEALVHLRQLQESFPELDRVFLSDPVGVLWASFPETPTLHGTSFADREWYQGVSRGWQPHVTGVYASPSDGALLFALVVPVRDPRGQVIGIIGSAQRLDIVRRWLASATVPGGDLYLVDRQGQLIFHPTRTGPEHLADFARVPVVERLLRGERGLAEIENPVERETRLTAYRPLSWLGWGLVVYRDPVRVLDATRLATRALEGAGSILTLAIAGLGVVALRNRRRALRALSELQAKTVALGAAQEELVRKERLALLGQLAGSVSHELRNPLGVMKNVVYYLNMTLPNEGRVRKHLQILDREVATANRIVSGLLDYARVRPSQPAPTDLNSLVTESLQRASVPQSVTVVANLARDLAPVAVDREQIGLVLGNLIGNAVQAMPEGGTLTVETAADGDGTRVSVADTGVGIAPEHVAKIFEPLFTTKPRGIGLGLSVVKSLAEANGGRVSVESAPGQGSRFVLHMGLAKADASARSRREG